MIALTNDIKNVEDGFSSFSRRIDRITENLSEVSGLTDHRINLYVDSTNGDDDNDGSSDSPFKTIQRAIDITAKVIDHDRYIYVKDGTYDEEVLVKAITGSAIYLQRWGGLVSSSRPTGVRVRSIVFMDINGLCRIDNIDFIGEPSGTSASVRFSRVGYGTVNSCRFVGKTSKTSVEFDGSTGSVNSSHFDNQKLCVESKNGSSVRVDSTNTHGPSQSDTGVIAQAAVVYINGSDSWLRAESPQLELQGGKVYRDVEVLDLRTLNGWSSYNETRHKVRAIKVGSTVFLQGLVKGGTPAQGRTVVQLPEGWRPQFNNRVHGVFSSSGKLSKVFIDTTGALAIESNPGGYVSLDDIPPFYAG